MNGISEVETRGRRKKVLPPWSVSRKWFVLAVAVGNLIFWAVPSKVVELVARQEPVLLGIYSRKKFIWMLGIAALSVISVFIGWGTTARDVRRRAYAMATTCLVFGATFLIADVFLRLRTEYPYQMDAAVYRRPANKVYRLPFEDKPEAARSYPVIQPGYGSVECIMSYDSRGYRNKTVPASCDIVTLGDSFTEGSRVSDDDAWPAQLERLSGQRVYNLGISGYNPPEYLASLKEYGLALKPKLVLCMLYEGNDFRSTRVEAKRGVTLSQVTVTSPILLALNGAILQTCGPIGAGWGLDQLDIVSWLPVRYPQANGRYYAFEPKQLIELNVTRDEFAVSEPWFAMKGILREMADACARAGAQFAIVYAPNKAHTIFPMAAGNLPREKVFEFVALRAKRAKMPELSRFVETVVTNIGNRQEVIGEWCAAKGIPFLPLTEAMRNAARNGKQPYYTYDQHWSPIGHEAAAREIATFCAKGLGRSLAAGRE